MFTEKQTFAGSAEGPPPRARDRWYSQWGRDIGATEALFGYRSPRGRTRAWWEERIHPEDRTRVLAGLACTLDGPADTWENEYRFRRADGSYGNVLARGSWCATVPASR